MSGVFGAVLFDWRGTLFHDEDEAAWIRASAASISQTLTTHDVEAHVEMLGAAAEHPLVVVARMSADCSAELHRAAVVLELRLAGFDDALATAICDRDGDLTNSYYHFALAAEGLRHRPWTSGMIYVLPRETFVPHPLVQEHGLTVTLEEWASAEAIVPVAQMEVGPEDFPFLHDFWGYDHELLAGRHIWTDLDRDNRELFPIRPRKVYT